LRYLWSVWLGEGVTRNKITHIKRRPTSWRWRAPLRECSGHGGHG
jgi:hypothetical protein